MIRIRMKSSVTRYLTALVLACALGAAAPEPAAAQTASGNAYGVFVDTPVASKGRTVVANLQEASTSGDMVTAEAGAVSVPSTLSSSFLNSTVTGGLAEDGASAQSIASVADIELLGGVIVAKEVVAMATSGRDGSSARSDANGSTFEDLVVNGVAVTSGDETVAPNTRIDLPGVGYVVLNEQVRSGDGSTSSGITVTMIRVALTDALTGAQVGEIVVGSASSAVE